MCPDAILARLTRRRQAARFVLLFEGRCGSGYLRALLKTSPHAEFGGERIIADHHGKPDAVARQEEAVRSFFAKHGGRTDLRAAGFKAKFSRVASPRALLPVLRDSTDLIIRLSRRNVVKQAISAIAGREQKGLTGKVHLLPGERPADPVAVGPDYLGRVLASIERREAALDSFLAGAGLEIHRMEYEDLLARRDETVRELCERLSLPFDSLDFRHESLPLKQVPDDLSKGIANLDELLAAYHGTRYEAMLRDTVASPSSPS